MPNPVLRSLRSLSNASPEARKVFFRCARHLTVNRQIYPQLAAPISVKTPPIPAAKLASTEFDGKFDGGFCGTYGACSTEVRLRYAAGRRAATALRPFHGLRLTLRWTLRFSYMGASAATP